ncbi:hypothetical protein [Psychromonas algicola]|uniref:hypothetical protein n=1 Tax=Psychromonas algicola TaxID=2555642 RepID=UPI0010687005|nr:hypothetical protein [Psychromonas sp. RZ5]TEW49858.1 hypothetical protein E2R67_10325 [Psychromonas sp. RZ5]
MIDYIIIIATMLILYFVVVRNKPAPQSDWETLPDFERYKKNKKLKDQTNKAVCIHCGSNSITQKQLQDKTENPKQTKFYHSCDQCRVILWRSER